MCVCVCERERERESANASDSSLRSAKTHYKKVTACMVITIQTQPYAYAKVTILSYTLISLLKPASCPVQLVMAVRQMRQVSGS